MTIENFWGTIPSADELKPPVSIAREQASVLSTITNKILIGDVSLKREGSNMSFTLDIVAPALDNYYYRILSASHGISMYPVRIIDHTTVTPTGNASHRCNTEEEYSEVLKQILGSEKVRRVIASLLAQSKDA